MHFGVGGSKINGNKLPFIFKNMEGPKFGRQNENKVEEYESLSERDKFLIAAQEALAPEYMARMSLEKIMEYMQREGFTFLGSESRERIVN